ncbi:MAG TPA: hypothetical protein VFU93_05175 [Acidimicrobiales bacterium]|nr:hypothetical protein [Acidimicrobiales bacterium]
MAKLRLVGWMVVTGVSAVVLLRDLTWTAADPPVAVMGVVRGVAGLLAAYLFTVTVLAVRLPRLAPRFVARMVAGALGTGLLVVPLAASAEPRPRPPAEAPILRRVPVPDEPRSRDRSVPDVARSGPGNDVVVVVAGDHLWSISERELTARLGRAPSDAEVVPFWLEVIELNHELADPDLVFPGTKIRLPS